MNCIELCFISVRYFIFVALSLWTRLYV